MKNIFEAMKCNLSILVFIILAAVFIEYGNGAKKEESKKDGKRCGYEYSVMFPKNEPGSCVTVKGKPAPEYLSCCELEKIKDWPRTDDEANLPLRIQKNLMLTILFSGLCAGTALYFHWWNAFTVLFTISRRLQILEKKIVACQERMNKRAFSDALIGKLAHAANFDFTAAQQEADTLLNSMTKGPVGGPGAGDVAGPPV